MKTLETCVKELTTKVNKHETEAEKWKNLEDRISTIESKVEESFVTNPTVEVELKCKLCNFYCSKNSDLKKHKFDNNQKVQKVKRCTICDETFMKNNQLESHLNTRIESEKFCCSLCGTFFLLKWRLKKRMDVHTTKK